MIKADVLRRNGWSESLTEDWELTLRLYLEGYKVLYTPMIQAPGEIPSTLQRLIRQRQRWAESHTFNARKYFWRILKSPRISAREKLEFLYYTPYYLQSIFLIIGTIFWLLSEVTCSLLPGWESTAGWALALANLLSLPLMSLTGLYLEGTLGRDWKGLFSLILITFLMSPFQAYSAIKGLIEEREGKWVRTYKTGKITESTAVHELRRLLRRVLVRGHEASKATS